MVFLRIRGGGGGVGQIPGTGAVCQLSTPHLGFSTCLRFHFPHLLPPVLCNSRNNIHICCQNKVLFLIDVILNIICSINPLSRAGHSPLSSLFANPLLQCSYSLSLLRYFSEICKFQKFYAGLRIRIRIDFNLDPVPA
jgi:hypothetical protein